MNKISLTRRIFCLFLAFTFLCQSISFGQAVSLKVPEPNATFVSLSLNSGFNFNFNFLPRNISEQQKKLKSKELLDYFFTSLSIDYKDLWVNLNPNDPSRIIGNSIADTDLGKALLVLDLKLKKDTAFELLPGYGKNAKTYWERVFSKAKALEKSKIKYQISNIQTKNQNENQNLRTEELTNSRTVSIPTTFRVWIVPDEAKVYETKDSITIVKATLKVLLESEYLEKSQIPISNDKRTEELQEYCESQLKQLILPELTQRVNQDKAYEPLRQIYQALILAQWYKKSVKSKEKNEKLKQLINSYQKTNNLKFKPEQIYKSYLNSTKGEYKLIDTQDQKELNRKIKRTYTSGGMLFAQTGELSVQRTATVSEVGRLPRSDIVNIGNADNNREVNPHLRAAIAVGPSAVVELSFEDGRIVQRNMPNNAVDNLRELTRQEAVNLTEGEQRELVRIWASLPQGEINGFRIGLDRRGPVLYQPQDSASFAYTHAGATVAGGIFSQERRRIWLTEAFLKYLLNHDSKLLEDIFRHDLRHLNEPDYSHDTDSDYNELLQRVEAAIRKMTGITVILPGSFDASQNRPVKRMLDDIIEKLSITPEERAKRKQAESQRLRTAVAQLRPGLVMSTDTSDWSDWARRIEDKIASLKIMLNGIRRVSIVVGPEELGSVIEIDSDDSSNLIWRLGTKIANEVLVKQGSIMTAFFVGAGVDVSRELVTDILGVTTDMRYLHQLDYKEALSFAEEVIARVRGLNAETIDVELKDLLSRLQSVLAAQPKIVPQLILNDVCVETKSAYEGGTRHVGGRRYTSERHLFFNFVWPGFYPLDQRIFTYLMVRGFVKDILKDASISGKITPADIFSDHTSLVAKLTDAIMTKPVAQPPASQPLPPPAMPAPTAELSAVHPTQPAHQSPRGDFLLPPSSDDGELLDFELTNPLSGLDGIRTVRFDNRLRQELLNDPHNNDVNEYGGLLFGYRDGDILVITNIYSVDEGLTRGPGSLVFSMDYLSTATSFRNKLNDQRGHSLPQLITIGWWHIHPKTLSNYWVGKYSGLDVGLSNSHFPTGVGILVCPLTGELYFYDGRIVFTDDPRSAKLVKIRSDNIDVVTTAQQLLAMNPGSSMSDHRGFRHGRNVDYTPGIQKAIVENEIAAARYDAQSGKTCQVDFKLDATIESDGKTRKQGEVISIREQDIQLSQEQLKLLQDTIDELGLGQALKDTDIIFYNGDDHYALGRRQIYLNVNHLRAPPKLKEVLYHEVKERLLVLQDLATISSTSMPGKTLCDELEAKKITPKIDHPN
ncbi:MAG: hypothetical protein AB1755_05820 [Candidatus Omnitrophota bacterium]